VPAARFFYLQCILFPYHLLFYFFEPIDFFRKKSPNQVQQALDPGFLLPFSGQRSTLYIKFKKPELRKCNLLNPGFLVPNRYFCQSAKDPTIFYFFLFWFNRHSIEPEYFGAINMIAPAIHTLYYLLFQNLFKLFYSPDVSPGKIYFDVSGEFFFHKRLNYFNNLLHFVHVFLSSN
jgi:hypothetical protein